MKIMNCILFSGKGIFIDFCTLFLHGHILFAIYTFFLRKFSLPHKAVEPKLARKSIYLLYILWVKVKCKPEFWENV